MRLERIELTNFRCFEKLEVNFHKNLTVLVGGNGAGKTAILESITAGFGAFLSRLPHVTGKNIHKDNDLRIGENGKQAPYTRVYLSLAGGVEWDRTEKRDQSPTTAQEIPSSYGLKKLHAIADLFTDNFNEDKPFILPILAYYDTSRAVFDTPKRKRNFKKIYSRFEALDGCLERTTNFKRLFQWFDTMQIIERNGKVDHRDLDYESTELKAVREAIQRVIPQFSNPIIEEHPLRFCIDHTDNNQTNTFHIEQLSDGFRITLSMVMDIASRMAEANPDVDDILDTPGIVIIDEVDLHLHPKWQQRILDDLQKAFPNIQFIVSTHSPQVLTTVAPESIRILRNNKVEYVQFSLGAKSSDLLNDIQKVSSRPEHVEIVQKLKEYSNLVANNEWDSPRGLELKKVLQAWGGEYESELLRLDTDIRIKEFERDNL